MKKKHALLSKASLLLFAACIALLIAGGLVALAASTQPVNASTGPSQDQVNFPAPPAPISNTISGEVKYGGVISKTYDVIVSTIVEGTGGSPERSTIIQGSGPYTITQVPAGAYFIFAYIDMGSDKGPPEAGEPRGWYDAGGDGQPDLVILPEGGVARNIDITLEDEFIHLFLPVIRKDP